MTFVRGKSEVYKFCATVVSGRFVLFLLLSWKKSEIVRKMQLWRKNLLSDDFVTELPIETTRYRGWHLISTVTCSLEMNNDIKLFILN